jgi:hypothetical protein
MVAIIKYVDKGKILWPELLRIILKSKKFDFYPLDENIH